MTPEVWAAISSERVAWQAMPFTGMLTIPAYHWLIITNGRVYCGGMN